MGQVAVTINNRKYDIACDDGQEAHLARLAQYIDKRVNELTAAVGQIGDSRLLVMVSLLVADELSEAMTELDDLRGGRSPLSGNDFAPEMEEVANRIEELAGQLENS